MEMLTVNADTSAHSSQLTIKHRDVLRKLPPALCAVFEPVERLASTSLLLQSSKVGLSESVTSYVLANQIIEVFLKLPT